FQALKKAEAMGPAVRESAPAPPRAPGVAPVPIPPLAAPLTPPMVRPLGAPALRAPMTAAVRSGVPEQVLREMTSLRVNLESHFPDRKPITIAITGAQGGEGASTVSAQFAIALAGDRQLRTLLVDTNAQRPALLVSPGPLAGLFEPDGTPGLDGTIDLMPVPEALQRGGIYAPAELEAALQPVRAQYDWIVIDLPSVLYSADSASLSAIADGVVVVVEAGRTKKPVLGRAVDLLRKAGARVIGSVLNRRQLEIPEFIYRRI
ncbi:MAG: CpsD/CapB family tyrosine-protein kinase, partial [Candidatus Eiseniibacteriota bacterium]